MSKNNVCGNGGCGCSESATAAFGEKTPAQKTARKEIDIEFLYLDLNVCDQCKGSESNLEEALSDVSFVLEKTGLAVNLKKIHIESFDQARALDFISSPTIRVGGRDVAFEVKENYCSSCSQLSGDETFCRVWNFQGEEFSTAPKSLIVEAVLKEIYGAGAGSNADEISPEQIEKSHANLKRFFEGRQVKEKTAKTKAITEKIILPAAAETVNASGCGCSSPNSAG